MLLKTCILLISIGFILGAEKHHGNLDHNNGHHDGKLGHGHHQNDHEHNHGDHSNCHNGVRNERRGIV